MLIINNRFLSVYDYNFLLFYEKIFSVKPAVDEKLFIMKAHVILYVKEVLSKRNQNIESSSTTFLEFFGYENSIMFIKSLEP